MVCSYARHFCSRFVRIPRPNKIAALAHAGRHLSVGSNIDDGDDRIA